VAVTAPTVTGLYVGTSGFSYPSWRPGFYPPEARPQDFLRLYAQRLPSVELNTTGYRLPAEDTFRHWAEATPAGFRFAVKMAPRLQHVGTFCERARLLGERLGPMRMVLQTRRDDGLLAFLIGALGPDLRVAFDFRHASWSDVDVGEPRAVRVGALDAAAPFRYLRFRDPPYDEAALRAAAERIVPLLERGLELYCYFRHEAEPTAPAYAERLRALVQALR
jgi:uncharacterized protein YecE (DUF72 family)